LRFYQLLLVFLFSQSFSVFNPAPSDSLAIPDFSHNTSLFFKLYSDLSGKKTRLTMTRESN